MDSDLRHYLSGSEEGVPVLQRPDFTKSFVLQTDASDRAVGAVLSQTGSDGLDHAVAYFSKNCYHERKTVPQWKKSALQSSSQYMLSAPTSQAELSPLKLITALWNF